MTMNLRREKIASLMLGDIEVAKGTTEHFVIPKFSDAEAALIFEASAIRLGIVLTDAQKRDLRSVRGDAAA